MIVISTLILGLVVVEALAAEANVKEGPSEMMDTRGSRIWKSCFAIGRRDIIIVFWHVEHDRVSFSPTAPIPWQPMASKVLAS